MKTVVAASIAALILAGCAGPDVPNSTPTSPKPSALQTASPSPTGTPTPTAIATSSREKKAIAAVEGYYQVKEELMREPTKYSYYEMSKALGKWAGASMITPNLQFLKELRADHQHYSGQASIQWSRAKSASKDVVVTVCHDARKMSLVNADGSEARNLGADVREFTVRRVDGRMLVVGEAEGSGSCGL